MKRIILLLGISFISGGSAQAAEGGAPSGVASHIDTISVATDKAVEAAKAIIDDAVALGFGTKKESGKDYEYKIPDDKNTIGKNTGKEPGELAKLFLGLIKEQGAKDFLPGGKAQSYYRAVMGLRRILGYDERNFFKVPIPEVDIFDHKLMTSIAEEINTTSYDTTLRNRLHMYQVAVDEILTGVDVAVRKSTDGPNPVQYLVNQLNSGATKTAPRAISAEKAAPPLPTTSTSAS